MTTVLLIAGMRNMGCRAKIATALGSLAGVTSAEVDYWNARATVVHCSGCTVCQLVGAVDAAGYSASLAGHGIR